MTIGKVTLSITETGKSRYGWKQWILRYNGALPDALLWVPSDLDTEMFMEFCRDLVSQSDQGAQ